MRLLVTYLRTGLVYSLLAAFSVAKAAPAAPLLSFSAIIGDNGTAETPPGWPANHTEWSGLTEAFLSQLGQTKLARAARTAYLDAEAADYGGATVSAGASADRDSAAAIFAYLDSRQRYVEELRLQDLTVLPTGMRKSWNNGNSTFEMGILKARFEPTRAFLTVFVRLRLPSPDPNSTIKERELFFGADDVEFTRSGGLMGDFKLVLLGDFIQPVGNVTLRFIGGLNRQSGATDNQTYVTISCERIAALRVTADVILPRSLVVPIKPTGEPTEGLVTGRISISAPRFPHFLTTVSLSPFAITGQEKFGFMVAGASLDLSDWENPPGFPAAYLSQNPGDSPEASPLAWRGVHIGALQVLLPPEFKEKGKSQRLTLGATNLIIDRTGVSGQVQMTGIPLELTASGWAMSLRRFRLDFERSKLTGGAFGGGLTLPIAPQDPLDYNALIDSKGDYLVTLAPRESLNFKLWRAKAKLDRASLVSLAVQNGEFRPQAILNGTLGVYTNLKGSDIGADTSKARIKFEGVVFQNLKLQTQAPYVSASYFGYKGDINMAGFPVSITDLGLVIGPVTGTTQPLGLRATVKVSLMKDEFSGSTDLTVQGKLDAGSGVQNYQFDRLIFNGLCVGGDVGKFKLNGCVFVFEDDPDYNDGFGGSIQFAMSEPTKEGEASPIKGGSMAALFGAKPDYRYWFVSGGVNLTKPAPIAGPLGIDAIYLTAYHNMEEAPGRSRLPVFLSASSSPYANVSFLPSDKLHLGFKAVVGLVAGQKDVFKGSAALEMTFSKHSGLNSVGFYGEGTLISSFSGLNGTALMGKLEQLPRQSEARDQLTPDILKGKATQQQATFKSGGAIYGHIALLYDRPNRTLHGDAEVFVRIGAPPLVIQGSGANGRAGWMEMHFDPTKWYVYVGRPEPAMRVGVRMGFPGLSVGASSYFMAGYGIPAIPVPPTEVTTMLPGWNAPVRSAGEQTDLQDGKGVAFGSTVDMNWNIDLWIPYIRARALMGFDMVVRNNLSCLGADRLRDFYARGQAYGLLQGEAGVKIGGTRPLISLGAGVLLEAGMPDPAWFAGEVALKLRLGRAFNKTISFDLALNKDNIRCR